MVGTEVGSAEDQINGFATGFEKRDLALRAIYCHCDRCVQAEQHGRQQTDPSKPWTPNLPRKDPFAFKSSMKLVP
jgi:hypothetical protein